HVYGWAVDAADDSAVRFAARALAAGLAVEASDQAFTATGRKFARGSLLVRGHENPKKTAEDVARAATDSGAVAYALTTARSSDESFDLGGQHFRALFAPKIAIAAGPRASTDGFGHVWHLIDRELGLPATLLDGAELGGTDLRRYDVLVLPSGNFDLAACKDDLKAWIRSGGTLIALEDSAVAVCNAELGLSAVRERGSVLAELDVYQEAARREDAARHIVIDEAVVYGDPREPEEESEAPAVEEKKPKPETPSKEERERKEEFDRRFAPTGVALRARVDANAWITAGAPEELPVFYSGSQVLYAKPPVRTAVRLAAADQLRLSGLIWPEARERLGGAAWLTVERVGRGQVILFAAQPNFRGFWLSGARFLSNAIVLGPGLGADPLRRP
ncbi:MAG TPA: hypothetical protein VM509_00285, partial [Planctomycetota bacterium]|nr:hypothetical protein [Planctomycetota bacterium]